MCWRTVESLWSELVEHQHREVYEHYKNVITPVWVEIWQISHSGIIYQAGFVKVSCGKKMKILIWISSSDMLTECIKFVIFLAALILWVQGRTEARKTWDFVLSFFQFEKVVSGMQFVCVIQSACRSVPVHSSSVKTAPWTFFTQVNSWFFPSEEAYCYPD